MARWKSVRRLSDDELLAADESWHAVQPVQPVGESWTREAYDRYLVDMDRWRDQYQAFLAEHGTDFLEVLRLRLAIKQSKLAAKYGALIPIPCRGMR